MASLWYWIFSLTLSPLLKSTCYYYSHALLNKEARYYNCPLQILEYHDSQPIWANRFFFFSYIAKMSVASAWFRAQTMQPFLSISWLWLLLDWLWESGSLKRDKDKSSSNPCVFLGSLSTRKNPFLQKSKQDFYFQPRWSDRDQIQLQHQQLKTRAQLHESMVFRQWLTGSVDRDLWEKGNGREFEVSKGRLDLGGDWAVSSRRTRQLEFTGQRSERERGPWRPAKGPPQTLSRALMDAFLPGNFWKQGKELLKEIGITILRIHADQKKFVFLPARVEAY